MLNMANFQAALKEMYPPDVLEDMTYQNNPLLAQFPKDDDAGGEQIKVPVIYAPPSGRSSKFATAVANKGNTATTAFLLTYAEDYSLASIARKVIMATRKDAHAFAEAAKTEVDQAFNNAVRSLAKAVYGSGNGDLGQIGSVTAANPMVITLANVNDITNFEVGMVLVADPAQTGGSLETTPGTITIAKVDRDNGTITTDFDNSGPTTDWSANDYLFQEGDEGAMIDGLQAWMPATVTSTLFNNVDRTLDSVRLGGVRHDGTGQSVEEASIDGLSKCGREEGAPDALFMNNLQYRRLIKSLGAKVEYVETGKEAKVYFSGVRIYGGPVPALAYQDFNCPAELEFGLQLDTWKLWSMGPAPHIFDQGTDQEQLREANADAVEVRCGYYAALGCKAPGYNVRITLDV